jgi:hypothetical protein
VVGVTLRTPDGGPPLECDEDVAAAAVSIARGILESQPEWVMGETRQLLRASDIGLCATHHVMNAAMALHRGRDLDENQFVRPDEVGRSALIQEATGAMRIPLREYDLATQFRCGGCAEYVQWVDYLLGFRSAAPEQGWKHRFKFSIVGDTEELEDLLEQAEDRKWSARLLAGFGWKWSDPLKGGGLVDDVRTGSWSRPWNPKRDAKKSYTPENDPYTIWATTDSGRDQVGCIYSAQGFEFDSVGVIWPPDLVWRKGKWVAQKDKSLDKPVKASIHMERLVRNAYRVLLTRSLQEARLLCLDAETAEHVAAMLREAR